MRPAGHVYRTEVDEYWRDRAACAGRTDVNWFPHPADDPTPALELCRSCPVQVACLTHAEATEGGDIFGVRGGLTEDDRRDRKGVSRSRTYRRRQRLERRRVG